MKVVIITNGLFPVPASKGGGAETLIQNLLDQNEIYQKIDFLVYSVTDSKAIEASKNYKYSKFRFIEKKEWGVRDLFYLLYHFCYKKILGYTIYRCIYDFNIVIDELKKIEFDYIVLENTLVPFEKLVNAFSDKVYVHIHNELFKPTYPKSQKIKYGKLINDCAGVITVSNYIKQYSLDMGYSNSKKFHVLLNSVDIKMFKNELLEDQRPYCDLANHFTFVYWGRICKEKGVLELLNAFSNITQEDVRLMIIGGLNNTNDSYVQSVKNLVDNDERVIVTGYIEHDEMWKYLKMADCAVLPSKWHDPCPLTIIEGMAAGLPIISCKTGGIPEEVNEDCAILLESNDQLETNLHDAMVRLYSDSELRKTMSKAANRRTQINGFFDLNCYYDRFVKILEGGICHE